MRCAPSTPSALDASNLPLLTVVYLPASPYLIGRQIHRYSITVPFSLQSSLVLCVDPSCPNSRPLAAIFCSRQLMLDTRQLVRAISSCRQPFSGGFKRLAPR